MQYTNVPTQTNQYNSRNTIAASSSTQPLSDESVHQNVRSNRLQMYLNKIIDKNEENNVTTSVIVQDLKSRSYIENHNPDVVQQAASLNKLPVARLILADLNSGKLKSNQVLTWQASDVRAGAGKYDQPNAPTSATVNEVLFDLLNTSGNTAVRVLVNYAIGDADTANTRFKTDLGLTQTSLQPLPDKRFYLGVTTSKEALINVTALVSGTDPNTRLIKNALATNIYTDYGVRSQLAGNDYITLVNKVGILNDVDGNNRHDVGVVYNTKTKKSYAYSIVNTAYGEASEAATVQAGLSIADMGRGILRYSGDKVMKSERPLNDARPFTEHRMRY